MRHWCARRFKQKFTRMHDGYLKARHGDVGIQNQSHTQLRSLQENQTMLTGWEAIPENQLVDPAWYTRARR